MLTLTYLRRACAASLVVAAACSDAAIPTAVGPNTKAIHADGVGFASEGIGVFHRYVSIGTSISMGVASDGVTATSQKRSWVAQLAQMAHREMTLPLISGTGCQAPLRAPLASGVRISGEPASALGAALACAGNEEGVVLPTQNVAIKAALTRDALFTTPENVTDPNNGAIYSRVLLPGQTQLTAALSQDPKIVSVELGGNEVLNARTGIAIPGVTLFPTSAWAPLYTRLVDEVAAAAKHGLLVGLIEDVGAFPGFRRGAELYADRAAFSAAFNVTVAADCDASENLLFVPVRVPFAVAAGLRMRATGAGAFTLSCVGAPTNLQDFVLTPDEASIVNSQLAFMNAYIRREADRVGFAHAELQSLYGRADLKAPFSVVQLMTSMEPYGQYVSLDGVHPSAAGHTVLAEAAAEALNARYGFGIPSAVVALGVGTSPRPQP